MSDLFPITRGEVIVEIEREIALRKRVYPRWIADRRLTRVKADRQVALLEEAARLLYAQEKATNAG